MYTKPFIGGNSFFKNTFQKISIRALSVVALLSLAFNIVSFSGTDSFAQELVSLNDVPAQVALEPQTELTEPNLDGGQLLDLDEAVVESENLAPIEVEEQDQVQEAVDEEPFVNTEVAQGPNSILAIVLSSVSTGQAPFDAGDTLGEDSSAVNSVIRNNDIGTISVNVSVNVEDAQDVVINIPRIPNVSYVFPIDCLAGSDQNASPNAICNLGDIALGTSLTIEFEYTANSNTTNGTVLDITAFVESTDSAPAISNTIPITTSSSPTIDVVNTLFSNATQYDGPNGENGFYLNSSMALRYEGDSANIGSEHLKDSFNYNIDVSDFGPNARLVTWGTRSSCLGSGTYNCTQTSPGDDINVDFINFASPANTNIALGFGSIFSISTYIWLPVEDVTDAPYNGFRSFTSVIDSLSGLEGVNGASNYGSSNEPIANNSDTTNVSITASQTGTFQKSFSINEAVRGEDIEARLGIRADNAFQPLPGGIICDKIDTRYFTVRNAPVTQNGSQRPTLLVEYGTGGYLDQDDQRTSECEDSDSPDGWNTDISLVNGGINAITKVRITIVESIVNQSISIRVPMSVNTYINNDVNQGLVPSNTPLFNFASGYFSGAGWIHNGVSGPNNSTDLVDTLSVFDVQGFHFPVLQDDLSAASSSFAPGEVFRLRNNVLIEAGSVPLTDDDLTYRVLLPVGLDFIENLDPNLPLLSETTLVGGETELIFDISSLYVPGSSTSSSIWAIRLSSDIGITTPSSLDIESQVLDSGVGLSELRTNTVTFPSSTLGGLNISLITNQTSILPGESFSNSIAYVNREATDLNNIDIISVNPSDADSLGSSFDGLLAISSVTAPTFEVIEYTNTTAANVNTDPNDVTNQAGGSTVWCSSFGVVNCPNDISEATAVRFRKNLLASSVGSAQNGQIEISYATASNLGGNEYISQVNGRSSDLPLAVASNIVSTDVVQSDLELTKTVNTNTVTFGEEVTYTLSVRNAGSIAETNIEVTDLLPNGFYVSDNSNGDYVPGTGVWNVGSLGINETKEITITAELNTIGVFTNTAEVTAQDSIDQDSTAGNNIEAEDDQDSVDVSVAGLSDLRLTKVVDNATPSIGDTVTYQIDINNSPGPTAATNVQVRDLLPAGLSYVRSYAFSPAFPVDYNPTTGIWNIPNIPQGFSFRLTIEAEVTGTGTITNSAEIIASDVLDVDSTPNNNNAGEDDQDSVDITVSTPGSVDLELTKTVNNSAPLQFENAVFTLTVSNQGSINETGIVVTDLLPPSLNYISDDGNGSYDSNTGTWTIGALNASDSVSLVITTQALDFGLFTNTAEITAQDSTDLDSTANNNIESEDDQDSVEVDVQEEVIPDPEEPDLQLTKTVDNNSPVIGGNVTYTLSITNAGTIAETNIEVTDVLPNGLTYVSDNSGNDYDETTGIWTIPSLAIGQIISIDIVANVTGSVTGVITNTAEVTYQDLNDVDSTPNNNNAGEDDQDSVDITVIGPDIHITLDVDNSTPSIGDTVQYTLVATLEEGVSMTGIEIDFMLPSGVNYISHSFICVSRFPAPFVFGEVAASTVLGYNETTGIWSISPLNGAEPCTLRVSGEVTGSGTITASAEVVSHNETDLDSTPGNGVETEDDQDSIDITIQYVDLEVEVVVSEDTVSIGDRVIYTVTVTNNGNQTETGISLVDDFPQDVVYVSDDGGADYDSNSGVWTVGTLNPGESRVINITVEVVADMDLEFTAQVNTQDSVDLDSVAANNIELEDDQARVSIAILQAPAVEVTISSETPIQEETEMETRVSGLVRTGAKGFEMLGLVTLFLIGSMMVVQSTLSKKQV